MLGVVAPAVAVGQLSVVLHGLWLLCRIGAVGCVGAFQAARLVPHPLGYICFCAQIAIAGV